MSDIRLGKLLDETAYQDAAHVAVAPVIAGERLVPGSHVGFVTDFDFERVGVRTNQLIGVVDPFLTEMVEIGQRCYMLLYPQTVTVLRHAWEHPAFSKAASQAWLNDCAKELGVTTERLLAAATRIDHDGYDDGELYAHSVEDAPLAADARRFWQHYSVVTGKKPSDPNARIVDFCC